MASWGTGSTRDAADATYLKMWEEIVEESPKTVMETGGLDSGGSQQIRETECMLRWNNIAVGRVCRYQGQPSLLAESYTAFTARVVGQTGQVAAGKSSLVDYDPV